MPPDSVLMVGRYALGTRLARGGMGEVYLATQLGLGGFKKPVVVKLLLPHLAEDPEGVAMFLHEAQLAARMKHPNIVEIYDVGVSDGRYYLAMELVRGVSMSRFIARLKESASRLDTAALLYVARRLCDALAHAHDLCGEDGTPLDVVHRDVTPHNVLLGAAGEVKLTDFGIAKARDSVVKTRPGQVRGKVAFIAPEQIEQGRVDHRSDLYSAALSLYQLATLETPFTRGSAEETLQAVLRGKLPPLAVARPDLPAGFSAAVTRALSVQSDQRFGSALEFRDALGAEPEPQAARQLAARVLELCGAQLDELHELTRSLEAGQATPGVASASLNSATVEVTGVRRRRNLQAAGAAAVATLLAALLAFDLWRSRRAPAAEPEPAVAAVAGGGGGPSAPEPEAEAPASEATAEPARAAPRVPSARAVGYLTVDARPWARVMLGSRVLGETPMDRVPVPAGDWALTLENPKTQKTVKKKVKVLAGKTVFVKEDLR
ncbi:MAG: serine/threonine protein kinase [Archangiaceae bacterium]|nr:serine/threonine protein kinase [Archangiaceae bacterium]